MMTMLIMIMFAGKDGAGVMTVSASSACSSMSSRATSKAQYSVSQLGMDRIYCLNSPLNTGYLAKFSAGYRISAHNKSGRILNLIFA